MKQTINGYQFKDAFQKCRPNNFSYEGLTALYEYFEEYEEGTGTEIELDVIAICCEFTEYDSLEEFQSEYYDDVKGDKYEDLEEIEEETIVIKIEGTEGFIIQVF
tara:strand:- start:82 stop:396 length:315 start_codon:yes stop_codon:yes gene_type:complete